MPKIYRNFVNCEHKKSLDSPRGHYNQYIVLAPTDCGKDGGKCWKFGHFSHNIGHFSGWKLKIIGVFNPLHIVFNIFEKKSHTANFCENCYFLENFIFSSWQRIERPHRRLSRKNMHKIALNFLVMMDKRQKKKETVEQSLFCFIRLLFCFTFSSCGYAAPAGR